MSFSLSIQATVGATDEAIDAAVEADIANAKANKYVPNVEAARELGMIEAAKAHVAAVVEKIARDGDTVTISLSGHANSSTDPQSGWASNMLNVSVTQVYATAETVS